MSPYVLKAQVRILVTQSPQESRFDGDKMMKSRRARASLSASPLLLYLAPIPARHSQLGREALVEHGEGDAAVKDQAEDVEEDEADEAAVVGLAHTVVEPDAVVVHPGDTEAALSAVLFEQVRGEAEG